MYKRQPEKAKPIASIHPILPEKRELDRWRARVEYQIEYHVLPDDPRVAVQFDEIVALMAETLCSGKETISMGGEEQPAETGKAQLKRLTSEHIEYVLPCMRRTTGPIRNSRRYLLTALYSAVSRYLRLLRIGPVVRRMHGSTYSMCSLVSRLSCALPVSAGCSSPPMLIVSLPEQSVSAIRATISSNCTATRGSSGST